MAKNILVVDDEQKIVNIIKAYLEREGHKVVAAYDGRSALFLARTQAPDLIILDLMLPELSGWEVCRILRAESNVPIIMLTARDEDTDKIVGLELGADDYVTKPFNSRELVARVGAVLRRAEGMTEKRTIVRAGDLSIDLERHEVRRGDRLLELTHTEFELLSVLAEHPGRVYTRMQLLSKVQGDAYEGYERTIDSHVKNLRKKIEPDPNRPQYLMTVWGAGYKLQERPDA